LLAFRGGPAGRIGKDSPTGRGPGERGGRGPGHFPQKPKGGGVRHFWGWSRIPIGGGGGPAPEETPAPIVSGETLNPQKPGKKKPESQKGALATGGGRPFWAPSHSGGKKAQKKP